ncbi:MAG TPA: DMT family transporter, partial [Terriglobales bacterium]|nr:DMT family transporter [Terriglobales bacterium]
MEPGNPFAGVALSLASALSWGAGDFSGGLASKKVNTFQVVAVAHGTGLVLVAALAFLRHEIFPGSNAMMWGGFAGISGAIGLAALYRGLAIGKMGTVAPVAAIITAGLPVIYGIWTQGAPKPMQLAGFALATIAIVLISKPEGGQGVPKGLGLGILAGFGFGGFLVCINRAGEATVFWPLVAARVVSLGFMLVLIAVGGRGKAPDAKSWILMMIAGALDSAGNALFVMATHVGRLDVAAVLSSLYPASTVLLARFVLQERMSAVQNAGMVAALVSIP